MIRVAWYTALILASLTVLVILWQFSGAVVMFLLSLAVAAAYRPLVEWLRQRGIRSGIAIAAAISIVVLTLLALLAAAAGPLVADLRLATDDAMVAYENFRNRWLPSTSPLYAPAVDEQESSFLLGAVFGVAEGTVEFFAHLAIVLVLSIYWSIDQVRFERLWLSLLPVEQRARARSIWLEIEAGVGAYIRREVTLSVIGGLCLWLGYLLLGVKYAMLFAFLGAAARLIPWVGPVLVVFSLFLFGGETGGWSGPLAAVYTASILSLLETTVGSRIFSRQRYSSLFLVVLVTALADSFGLLGAVLAPILAVAVQILVKSLLPVNNVSTHGESLTTLADLRTRLGEIRGLANTLELADAAGPASLISRLERLLEKTEEAENFRRPPGFSRDFPARR